MSERVQRLRITYARDDVVKYVGHLDLMRSWERILTRAALPMARSEGFTPRPRLALAAPLPVGVTSECEALEVHLTERLPLARIWEAVPPQLPAGLRMLDVGEEPLGWPALQARVLRASYRVEVEDPRAADAWRDAIDAFLGQATLSWEEVRGEKTRRYDLRALVLALSFVERPSGAAGAAGADGAQRAVLRMTVRHDAEGAGRPEQVTRALGVADDPWRMHRERLEITEPSIARERYEARGRRED